MQSSNSCSQRRLTIYHRPYTASSQGEFSLLQVQEACAFGKGESYFYSNGCHDFLCPRGVHNATVQYFGGHPLATTLLLNSPATMPSYSPRPHPSIVKLRQQPARRGIFLVTKSLQLSGQGCFDRRVESKRKSLLLLSAKAFCTLKSDLGLKTAGKTSQGLQKDPANMKQRARTGIGF